MPFDLLRRKPAGPAALPAAAPAADIHEQDQRIILKLEMPGVDRKTLRVDQQGRELTIRGVREGDTAVPKGYRAVYQERCPVEYVRAFEVNEEVDLNSIQAAYADGVLTVELTKKSQAVPRRIEIRAG